MKNIAISIALLLVSGLALADCPALDYQEMKEMKPDDLSKEYCKAKSKSENYAAQSKIEKKYSSDLQNLNAFGRSRARDVDADEATSKAAKLKEAADQCQSQESRTARILVARGLDETSLKTICTK